MDGRQDWSIGPSVLLTERNAHNIHSHLCEPPAKGATVDVVQNCGNGVNPHIHGRRLRFPKSSEPVSRSGLLKVVRGYIPILILAKPARA